MLDLCLIGSNLASLRQKAHLSQEDIAAKLFVSRQAVSAWEMAKSAPSIDNVLSLAALYGVSFEEILGLGEKATFDKDNPFLSHERSFVVRSYIGGKFSIPFEKIFFLATGEERKTLLIALKNKKVKANKKKLEPLLSHEEKRLLSIGEKL